MNKKGKKKLLITLIVILIALILFLVGYLVVNKYVKEEIKHKKEEDIKQKEVARIKTLTENYNIYIKTNKEAKLYKLVDNKYKEVGNVSKDMYIVLEEIDPSIYKEEYIKLKNIDYYIFYKDITKSEEENVKWSNRYKNYIPFNQNVVLTGNYDLYINDNQKFSLTEDLSLPIIINETDRYYVEYDNRLVYVMKNDSLNVVDNINTTEESTEHLAIINYHFIIDPSTDFDCTNGLCMSKDEFDSHMKLISDEGYFTLNTKELSRFIDGKIKLHKKSVMITEDDGWYAYNTSAILQKYDLNATLFLITSSYSNIAEFETPYLEVHSHGNDLHVAGECPQGSRGARILCFDHDKLVADLKRSRELLNNSTVFCYPFYEYNDYAISALQEAGFEMAFAGGGRDVYIGENKYIIPRYGINAGISLDSLKRIITVN